MINLPPMSQVGVVRLSKEGGLAYIPGLVQRRIFELGRCSDALRDQIDQAMQDASAAGQRAPAAGGGDQRFFHIELAVNELPDAVTYSFEVPEADAPQTLAELLQVAVSEDGVSSGAPGAEPAS